MKAVLQKCIGSCTIYMKIGNINVCQAELVM